MPLPRLQLVELEDLTWFPHTIRDLATDYLQFMETRFDLQAGHSPAADVARELEDIMHSRSVYGRRRPCAGDIQSSGCGRYPCAIHID